jgi:hypothetical protein
MGGVDANVRLKFKLKSGGTALNIIALSNIITFCFTGRRTLPTFFALHLYPERIGCFQRVASIGHTPSHEDDYVWHATKEPGLIYASNDASRPQTLYYKISICLHPFEDYHRSAFLLHCTAGKVCENMLAFHRSSSRYVCRSSPTKP